MPPVGRLWPSDDYVDDDDDEDVEDGGDDDHDVYVLSQEEQPARGGQQHPALRLRQPSSLSQHRHQQAEVGVNICLFKTKRVKLLFMRAK